MTICGDCQLWPLHADDVYCSWCQAKLVGYAVRLDREVLVLQEGPLSVWLTVDNRGQTTLEIEAIRCSEPWITDPDVAGHPLLPSGPPLSVELHIEHALLDKQRAYTATITVTMNDGSAPESVTLQVVPPPQVHVEIEAYEVLLDDSASRPHTGRVILDKGAVHLLAPQCSEPWLSVGEDPPWPRLLAGPPGTALSVDLYINTALLRERLPRPYTAPVHFHQVQLTLHGTEFEQPIEHSFPLTCTVPPELHLQGLRGDTLHVRGFTERSHEVKVNLENQGGQQLVVSQIALDPTVPWLQIAPSQRVPLPIDPGQVGTVALQLDGMTLDTGTYRTSFTLVSNNFPESQMKVPVAIHIETMQVYDGVVAFDFGTTNSCAVVWDSSSPAPRMIPLELTGPVPTTIPSVILYNQLLAGEHKVYQVGTDAKMAAPLIPESAVRSIKRFIGKRTPVSIVFNRDGQKRSYLPEEIAQDIIAHIIGQVESYLGQRISSCVITHPSTFAPSQLAALKRVFMACGVAVEMTFHEPVAAALEYILNPEQAHQASHYTLLVYDFGGGTTDITLLEVDDVRSAGMPREITPKIRGASGRQRFGGEDVTAKVVQELCDQFNAWLIRNGTPYRLEANPDAIALLEDPEEQRRARLRYNALLHLAEELKINIANDPHPGAPYPVRSGLEISHEGRSIFVQPRGELTLQRLNDLIRGEIENTLSIVHTLIQRANLKRPDVILLSGQSSRLPIVYELFTKSFSRESIRWAGQQRTEGAAGDERIGLKECVARGACWAAWAPTLLGAVTLNSTDMQPMATARIGLMAMNADGQTTFKAVIAAGESVGIPQPIEGVRVTRRSRLQVLENTGSSDDLPSPDIEELGIYALEKHLPSDVTDNDMRHASLAMELTRDYEVKIHVQIPHREPFSFVCERWVKE